MKNTKLLLMSILAGLFLISAGLYAQNVNGSDNGNKLAQTFSVGSILVDGNSSNEVQISELDNLCILVSINGESITFTCGYEMICPGSADDAKVQIHFTEGGGNPNLDYATTGGNASGTLSITKTLNPGELTSGKVRLYAFYKDWWGVIVEEEWEYSYNTTSPPPPNLLIPTVNQACIENGNTFDWTSVSGANKYRFWIDGDFPYGSPFWPFGGTVEVTSSSFTYTGGYYPNNSYKWKVKTREGSCWGNWNVSQYFTTYWIPDTPSLQEPSNGADCIPYNNTYFDWSEVLDAIEYEISINGDEYTATSSNYNKTLSPGTTYNWKVKALGDCDYGGWSSTWSFTTDPDYTPPSPTLISPTDNAECIDYSPTNFDWSNVSGAYSYEIDINPGGSYQTSSSNYSINLNSNTWYDWRVRSLGECDWGSYSNYKSFKTAPLPPGTPTLSLPTNNDTDVSFNPTEFDWNSVSGADGYKINISSVGTFYSTDANYSIVLNPGTTYSWEVSAENECGVFGPWSQTWNFTTSHTEISGTITTLSGCYVDSVKVTATPGGYFDYSDGNGDYSINNIPFGAYTVTPYRSTYGFEHIFYPPSDNVSIDVNNYTDTANFIDESVFPVSGHISFDFQNNSCN
ncbi:MAG: carboxypeptidase-like regulatory domain-containing protein, partial [Bacteroidales bacterium]|nr:carboxypeptidase-like regulatory domain-containing protein [Bacteroidales bacterium]